MLRVVADEETTAALGSTVGDIARDGALRLLTAALEAEADAYVASFADHRDARGHRLVVRNGYTLPRHIETAAGPIHVTAPRIHDRRTEQSSRFQSVILPPWSQLPSEVAQSLPGLYLHGMATRDFTHSAKIFSDHHPQLAATTKTRLMRQWQEEADRFYRRSLANHDYVCVWADTVHYKLRPDQRRLCALVIVGVHADGGKEMIAIADGTPDSSEDWTDLLRSLRLRGMQVPATAIADETLGFWDALADLFRETRVPRSWVRTAAEVLPALAVPADPNARRALIGIHDATDPVRAMDAIWALSSDQTDPEHPPFLTAITIPNL